jgi:hypothetical protein
MDHITELELCEPLPFIFGDNGHLGVTDGTSMWIVVVTCEAMRATAKPPESSLKRLARYSDLYRSMAEAAIERQEDSDGKVWIFEKDIVERLATKKAVTKPRTDGTLSVLGH